MKEEPTEEELEDIKRMDPIVTPPRKRICTNIKCSKELDQKVDITSSQQHAIQIRKIQSINEQYTMHNLTYDTTTNTLTADNTNEKHSAFNSAKPMMAVATNVVQTNTTSTLMTLTNSQEERKVHKVKLRTKDGKDFNQVNLLMTPRVAKSLHGKIIKLARMKNANHQVKDTVVQSNPVEKNTITYQPTPLRIDDYVNLSNSSSLPKQKITTTQHVSLPSKNTVSLMKHGQLVSQKSSGIRKLIVQSSTGSPSNIQFVRSKLDARTVHVIKPVNTLSVNQNSKEAQDKTNQETNSEVQSSSKPVIVINRSNVQRVEPAAEKRIKLSVCDKRLDYQRDYLKRNRITISTSNSKTISHPLKINRIPLKSPSPDVIVIDNEIPQREEMKVESVVVMKEENAVPNDTTVKENTKESRYLLTANDLIIAEDNSIINVDKGNTLPVLSIKSADRKLTEKNPVLVSHLKSPVTPTSMENKTANTSDTTKSREESLSVIEQAVYSIPDKDLRIKALKALAECGICVERHLPIIPVESTRVVCERVTQTEVFGLLEEESFILANEDAPELKRIRQRAQMVPEDPEVIKKDVAVQMEAENFEQNIVKPDISMLFEPEALDLEKNIDIDRFFENLSTENPEVSKVKNVLSQQNQRAADRLALQLQKDVESIKIYDEDGMLGIHRAIVDNNLSEVRRLLVLLKAFQEDANIKTSNEMTCLEVAISSDASPEIVSALLDAGAAPVTACLAHDSAIILASKQSSSCLANLVAHVKDPFFLNMTGPEGFNALHYCAMLGNLDGVRILLDAGANVNVKDMRSGRTALFHAIENNHVKISALLYERGASVTTPNFSGQTIFTLLQESTNSRLRRTFSHLLTSR